MVRESRQMEAKAIDCIISKASVIIETKKMKVKERVGVQNQSHE